MTNHSERDHALLSASGAHRWLACPPSAVAAEAYPSQDTEYTQEGTTAHEVAEIVARAMVEGVDFTDTLKEKGDAVTSEMLDCAIGYAAYIEERIKSDNSVVLLEQRVDFSPWVPDGFGTADCIMINGTTMDVIDYKYGKGVAVSATDNPQMKLYGLGALNDFGFAAEIETVRLHIFQPRINSISVDEIRVPDLLVWAEQIVKPTAEKAAQGKGDYCAGEHCRFCPHAGRCRELTKTCTEFIEIHGKKFAVEHLAAWEVADILRMESVIALWLKRVKDQALTTLMDGGDVPGFKVVAGRGSRAWADDLEVADALEAAGYTQDEITKTELLSVAAMEKALGKKKVAELVGGQILTYTGSPTIAPVTDKRPVYDRLGEAQKDFGTVED